MLGQWPRLRLLAGTVQLAVAWAPAGVGVDDAL
jgi:hypothetical protein